MKSAIRSGYRRSGAACRCACAGPSRVRRGWNKNSLPAGTEILVEGFQAKDQSKRANESVITFANGKKLFVGNAAGDPGAAPGAPKQ